MTDIPKIIQTKIVSNKTDVFWGTSDILKSVVPRTVLVITRPIDEDSAENEQLAKILAACKLQEEQYNIIQINSDEQLAWHQIKQAAQPAVIILFGIPPSELGISALFRFNNLNNYDKTQWIPTLALDKLEQDTEVKKQLWAGTLKPLFADKE